MNRVLVAGIAGLAMLVSAGMTTQDCYAGFGRKCGGGGGLFSGLGGGRCGGAPAHHDRCGGGGLLAKLRAKKAADCGCPEPAPVCCEPEPVCCEPAPVCCEPAPAPVCCEPAPAPVCCEPAPTCCEPAPSCCEPVSTCDSCGTGGMMMSSPMYYGGTVVSGGCPNCSTTMDSGVIMESAAPMSAPPAAAPPAPAPTPDPAADAPST